MEKNESCCHRSQAAASVGGKDGETRPQSASKAPETNSEIACNLGVFDASERSVHANSFEALVIGRGLALKELSDGYCVKYPGDAQLFARLASWIANERRCCPFFTFELRLEPEGGALWMQISGPEGAKALLKPELERIPMQVPA
jgi:hypothetical protein